MISRTYMKLNLHKQITLDYLYINFVKKLKLEIILMLASFSRKCKNTFRGKIDFCVLCISQYHGNKNFVLPLSPLHLGMATKNILKKTHKQTNSFEKIQYNSSMQPQQNEYVISKFLTEKHNSYKVTKSNSIAYYLLYCFFNRITIFFSYYL